MYAIRSYYGPEKIDAVAQSPGIKGTFADVGIIGEGIISGDRSIRVETQDRGSARIGFFTNIAGGTSTDIHLAIRSKVDGAGAVPDGWRYIVGDQFQG